MRSSDWLYAGYLLIGAGGSLAASGLIAFFHFRGRPWISSRYDQYTIPLFVAGICIMIIGALAFRRYVSRRREEANERGYSLPPPPPPPPLLPPPPPPPP